MRQGKGSGENPPARRASQVDRTHGAGDRHRVDGDTLRGGMCRWTRSGLRDLRGFGLPPRQAHVSLISISRSCGLDPRLSCIHDADGRNKSRAITSERGPSRTIADDLSASLCAPVSNPGQRRETGLLPPSLFELRRDAVVANAPRNDVERPHHHRAFRVMQQCSSCPGLPIPSAPIPSSDSQTPPRRDRASGRRHSGWPRSPRVPASGRRRTWRARRIAAPPDRTRRPSG
jgi:hypothetical protein